MSDGKRLLIAIGGLAGALATFFFAAQDVASAAAELKGVCDELAGDEEAEQAVEDMVIDVDAREAKK